MLASKLTAEQVEECRRLRFHENWSWSALSRRMGVADQTVKRMIVPGYQEERRKQVNAARARLRFGMVGRMHSVLETERNIPREVIIDREARINAVPRDLTGLLLGDPPAGFSALDRRAP